jgi:hypothetical protein
MRGLLAGLLVAAAVAVPVSARAAPSQLYGKAVTVSWSETRSQRAAGEPAFHPVSIPFTLTIYISTEGHIFRRIFAVTPNGRTSGSKDRTGASSSGASAAFSAQFQGNAMIASASNGGFGLLVRVTFDGGFASCTAQVIGAKQSGSKTVTLRSVASGSMIEVESVSAGPASCSVAQGNPFAN